MKKGYLLTADEFTSRIRRGESWNWRGRQISGDVDLTGITVEDPLIIQYAVFTGEVNFGQARFKRGLDFTGCHFKRKLILSDARVDGPLKLDNVTIGSGVKLPQDVDLIRQIVARLEKGASRARSTGDKLKDQPPPKRARLKKTRLKMKRRLKRAEAKWVGLETLAEFDNLHVEGALSMTRIQVCGEFSCNHADVQSDLRMDDALIYGDLLLRHARLGELRNDSNLLVDEPPRHQAHRQVESCMIGGTLDLDTATITGDVFLIGITIRGQLRLQAADVNGNFVCRSAKGARTNLRSGAWLLAARIKGIVDFSGARLRGNMTLDGVNVGGNLRCRDSRNWLFTVDGDATATSIRVAASFDWTSCNVKGNLNASGARIENDVYLSLSHITGDLSFQNAAIAGDLDCSGARIEKTIHLQSASVGGAVFLRTTSDGEKNVRCRIGKKAWLLAIKVTGDIDISGIFIEDDLMMQDADIGQNLLATILGSFQSEIRGTTFLNGAHIGGEFEFLGVKLHNELNVSSATIDGKLRVAFDLDDKANWKMVESSIGGRLHALSATIGKSVYLMGLTTLSADRVSKGEPSSAHLNFVGAQISGEFALYDQNYANDMVLMKQAEYESQKIDDKFAADIRQRTLAERTVVHGDVCLNQAHVLGGVVLDGATIEGDLEMRDATVKSKLNCKPVQVNGQRVSVRRADLEALDMTGDIDLTGLNITGKGAEGVDGDLILRNARVRGRLELCPFNDERGPANPQVPLEPISRIRGDLRLDAAEISHIILSGQTFDGGVPQEDTSGKMLAAWRWLKPLVFGGTDEEDKAVRFGLERGRIGRLQIVEPLPGTLDLSNLRVDRWSLPEDQTSYERMLRNSYPFKRSNYLAIENTLRNEGLDERADEVNVAMRRRDRLSTTSLWKIWFDSFLDLSIKYGTTSKRLVCVMIALFALSVWIFSNPNHVEYNISPASQKPPPVEHPAPASWGLPQSALFAARLNVPIVSLGIDEKVQPSGFGLKVFAIGVTAASWVMWPLLVASMSGFIRKKN